MSLGTLMADNVTLNSPDNNLQLTVSCTPAGEAFYSLTYKDKQMLLPSLRGGTVLVNEAE